MMNGLLLDALRAQFLRMTAVFRGRSRSARSMFSFSDTLVATGPLEPPTVVLHPRGVGFRVHRTMEPLGSRSLFGDGMLVTFLIVQLSDGVLTYLGVQVFGPSIEGNPILAWCMAAAGVGSAIVSIKMFAIFCGAILHLQARHRTIGILTVFYLAAAVWQWTVLLASTNL